MRRLLLVAVVFTFPVFLNAEDPEEPFRYYGNGHLFFTAGACQHGYALVGAGGGGEGMLWHGLTIGGEIGIQTFAGDARFGTAGLNVGYHFVNRNRPQKLDPFVKVTPLGVAMAGGVTGWGGIGGGLNYWFTKKIALRTEVMAQAIADEERIVAFRIGLSFR
jgi:hypothetical protein